MLIKSSPDRYDKLQILGGMAAADDILTAGKADSGGHSLSGKFAAGSFGRGPNRVAYSDPRKNPARRASTRASLPNGKKISLLRVMFTDFCKMDCAYCPNSIYVPRKRYCLQARGAGRHLCGAAPASGGGRAVPQLRHRRRRHQDHPAHGGDRRDHPQEARVPRLHPLESHARRQPRTGGAGPPAGQPAFGQHRDGRSRT